MGCYCILGQLHPFMMFSCSKVRFLNKSVAFVNLDEKLDKPKHESVNINLDNSSLIADQMEIQKVVNDFKALFYDVPVFTYVTPHIINTGDNPPVSRSITGTTSKIRNNRMAHKKNVQGGYY